MSLKFVVSERGKPLLVLEDFTYRLKRELKNGEKFWTCTKSNCNAKVFTVGDVLSRRDTTHHHEADPQTISRKVISSTAKRKATENLSERPSKIIHSALIDNVGDFKNLTVTDINSIKRNIYNERRKTLPPLPKSTEDVIEILKNMDIRTVKMENFLSVCDEENKIVVFSCDSNLRFLSSCDKMFMDGTFQFCTKYFCQLFSIHVVKNGHYIPVAFCLLTNKAQSTYVQLFRLIQRKLEEINCAFLPKCIVADFEQAIHGAISQVWPHCAITGCRFHLGQAWYRNIQKLGLSNDYQNPESEKGEWLRYLFGLPFLDPEDVGDCFALDFAEFQPVDDSVTHMADYLVTNYISEDAKFPPTVWASQSASTELTTNACESFHSHFNAQFYASHPSIFSFIDTLKQCQTTTYLKIQSLAKPKKIQNKAVRQRHETITAKIEAYKSGSITRLNFVKCISYLSKRSK